jgi:hypothetical protein
VRSLHLPRSHSKEDPFTSSIFQQNGTKPTNVYYWANVNFGYPPPPDHLLLDSAPNLGPLISRWKINKFENWWYKSVRTLEVLKLLFQQFLDFSSSQQDMSGPRLGALSNNRWLGCSFKNPPATAVIKVEENEWSNTEKPSM